MRDCGICFKCKEGRGCIRSVTISAAATPSRRPGAVKQSFLDKRWDKDHAAYKELRKQGLQPAGIDNADQMARGARTRYEIEAGVCMPNTIPTKELKSKINQGHEISAANNVQAVIKGED